MADDLFAVGRSTIQETTCSGLSVPVLRILHFNDVYHVEGGSHEPAGGAARLQTMRNLYSNDIRYAGQSDLTTFFSGDAFNPSLESTITKGKHMVPILNDLGTQAACLGNHDLDFGVEQFRYLAKQCNFPWLCSNVLDPALGEGVPLGNCQRTHILTSTNGVKIGLLGLVEQEWLDAVNFLPANLEFITPSQVALELVPQLRDQGAEIIIVLAHQRMNNDIRLAKDVPPGTIDIILGGHDHTYEYTKINGIAILRSGTDFKQCSYIEARRLVTTWDFKIVRHDLLSPIIEDKNCLTTITAITGAMNSKLEKPVGYVAAPLDARFTTVRLAESNLGNFLCDLLRLHCNAECSIICGGTIRGDRIYPPGMLKVRDIVDCLPFEDTCVVVTLPGKAIVEALENGVSKWPALDGRFPQVSGIRFCFDPNLAPGRRISDVYINKEAIDVDREYAMATRDYMTAGKDGYRMLMSHAQGGQARVTVAEESGFMLSMLVRQYFLSLRAVRQWRNWSDMMDAHWQRIHADLHSTHPVQELHDRMLDHDRRLRTSTADMPLQASELHQFNHFELSDSEDEGDDSGGIDVASAKHELHLRRGVIVRRIFHKWMRLAKLSDRPDMIDKTDNVDIHWTRAIAPRLEGRIRRIEEVR